MTLAPHTNFWIITRDGIAVDSIDASEHAASRWIHQHHSYSLNHALEHEGYAIESREVDVRGWLAYLTITSREGYGFEGVVLRTVKDLHSYLVDREKLNDYIFSDSYLSAQFDAIETGLSYLEGNASIVNGRISQWIEDMKELYSI